ncbi:MAG: glycosyltransferase family 4 protein [Pedobacter sp.]
MKSKNIGIVHNTYLLMGGEDLVAENEYNLLKEQNLNVFFLKFQNPENTVVQFIGFLFSFFNLISFFKCINWLKKNKIEVMHVHNWFYLASPSIFWAAKFCKVPIVLTLHNYRLIYPSGVLSHDSDTYLKNLSSPFPWDAINDRVYRNSRILTFILAFTVWINKKVGTWKLIDQYIILTEQSKEIFQKSSFHIEPQKFKVKPNFVIRASERKQCVQQEHFLYVGRLSQEKGVDFLLEAFSDSTYKLKIIGDGPLQSRVEKFVANNPNVSYLGFQNREAIERELSLCSAVIFPSICSETFGLVIIEAFASSTPVIASSIGGSGSIVKDQFNGLHFEKSNLSDLRSKLKFWTSLDDSEKARYRTNAYNDYLQNYSPKTNIEQLLQIYQSTSGQN